MCYASKSCTSTVRRNPLCAELLYQVQSNTRLYDAWVMESASLSDVVAVGGVAPLDELLMSHSSVEWSDVVRWAGGDVEHLCASILHAFWHAAWTLL